MLWGVLYRDENKKGYVGKKGSSFKETANIFYGGLYLITKGILEEDDFR